MYRQHAGPSPIKKRDRLINNYMEDRPNDCSIASHPKRDDGSDKPVTTYTPPWELYGEKSFIEKTSGKSKSTLPYLTYFISEFQNIQIYCLRKRKATQFNSIGKIYTKLSNDTHT